MLSIRVNILLIKRETSLNLDLLIGNVSLIEVIQTLLIIFSVIDHMGRVATHELFLLGLFKLTTLSWKESILLYINEAGKYEDFRKVISLKLVVLLKIDIPGSSKQLINVQLIAIVDAVAARSMLRAEAVLSSLANSWVIGCSVAQGRGIWSFSIIHRFSGLSATSYPLSIVLNTNLYIALLLLFLNFLQTPFKQFAFSFPFEPPIPPWLLDFSLMHRKEVQAMPFQLWSIMGVGQ